MLSHVFKAKVSQQQEERLPALPAEAGKKPSKSCKKKARILHKTLATFTGYQATYIGFFAIVARLNKSQRLEGKKPTRLASRYKIFPKSKGSTCLFQREHR